MAIVGNTIQLKGQFLNFDGEVVQATEVKFIVYDTEGVITEIAVASPNAQNEYVVNYIVPAGTGSFNVKLYGLIDTYPEVGLVSITREQ